MLFIPLTLFYFSKTSFGRDHALLLAFKLSTFNPFPSCKKWHSSLYTTCKTRNVLEHVIYKFPFPRGSRGVIPRAAGGILPALLLSGEVLIAPLGTQLLRQTPGLRPAPRTDPALSSAPCGRAVNPIMT